MSSHDTERIVAAWQEFSRTAPPTLNGMITWQCAGDTLEIGIANAFVRDHFRTFYLSRFREMLGDTTSLVARVIIVARACTHTVPDAPEREMPIRESDTRDEHAQVREPRIRASQFDEEFDLAHLIEGPGNRMVCRVIRDLAEGRADAYNSQILIHGFTGTGKSHALFCIGRSMVQANPEARVVYVRAPDFVQEYVDAAWGDIGAKELFGRKYRTVDVLLLDDAHAFSGEKSQMRFIGIVEALRARKGIVAIGAEKPPHEFSKAVLPALRSRFLSMLVLPLAPHDEEMAVRILMKKAECAAVPICEEWAQAIVRRVGLDARVLAGVVKRLKIEPELIFGAVDAAALESVFPPASCALSGTPLEKPTRRRLPQHLRMVMGGDLPLESDT